MPIELAPQYTLDPKDGWHNGSVTMLKGSLAVTKECIWRDLSFEQMPSRVQEFVGEGVKKFNPDKVFICDGSMIQKRYLIGQHPGIRKLSKYEEVYAIQTDPADVARVESMTFLCGYNMWDSVPHTKPGVKGVLAQFKPAQEMAAQLYDLQTNCMVGQTMYVIPLAWVRSDQNCLSTVSS